MTIVTLPLRDVQQVFAHTPSTSAVLLSQRLSYPLTMMQMFSKACPTETLFIQINELNSVAIKVLIVDWISLLS